MSTSAAAFASRAAVASRSSSRATTSSAPTAASAASRSGSRPAPTTRPAPSRLATWTAIVPALPVAPRTRTDWPRLERDPAAEGHPGRHGRVHGRRDLGDVGAVGQRHGPPGVDDGLLGHRAPDVIGDGEVDQAAVGQPADPVDAGDHRQRPGAGVVPARRARADPRVQPDREHVGQPSRRARWAGARRTARTGAGGRRNGPRRRACSCWLVSSSGGARGARRFSWCHHLL